MAWAWAGVAGGRTYGSTDDFSYSTASDPVHIRDLNATVLHTLGINHERLSVRMPGLDQRLTGVEPSRIIRDIMA